MTIPKQSVEELAVWQGSVDAHLENLQANHVSLKMDVGELRKEMGVVQIKLENVAVKAGLWGAVGAVLGSAAVSAFVSLIWYAIKSSKP